MDDLTIGNAVNKSKYTQIGKTVYVKIMIVFGSTTTILTGDGTGVVASLPVAMHADYTFAQYLGEIGRGAATDVSLSQSAQPIVAMSKTSSSVTLLNEGQTTGYRHLSPTVPQPWAAGDVLLVPMTYEAA